MAARLDAADADKQQLGDQVRGLTTRLDTPPTPPPPPPAPEPTVSPDEFRAIVGRVREITNRLDATEQSTVDDEPTVDRAAFESVSQEVHTLGERIDELDTVRDQVQSVATRLDQLDARITSISNELANQITELSGDLEALEWPANRPPSWSIELRDTQLEAGQRTGPLSDRVPPGPRRSRRCPQAILIAAAGRSCPVVAELVVQLAISSPTSSSFAW